MSFQAIGPKPDFVALELKLLKFWYQQGVVAKYLSKNRNTNKKFSFLDGPITANNPMGVHHAWGRTYKDLWQRFFAMQGYKQRFQNGFDEQGLWVEVEVERELGLKNKKDIENLVGGNKFASIAKFVNLCKTRVKKYSAIQTEQSKRLGYFMDWDNSYHTSSDENNVAIWNFLKVCYEKGYVYKGRDSVPWCPRCGTAISQHEILTEEYAEITHKAVFVKYKILNTDDSLIVWTTTPWTLPSNVAIAVNPEFDYWRFTNKSGENVIIVNPEIAKESGNEIIRRLSLLAPEWEVKRGSANKFKGSELVGGKYRGPFDELPKVQDALKQNFKTFHTVVPAKDLVNAEEGTGLVHIAPGAGEEDFKIAKEQDLSVIESIDESANYIEGFEDLTGKNAKENPDLIIEKIKEKDVLFKVEDYTHRYPTCWRCKTELVWRVVDEWYIAMDKKDPADKKGRTLREQMVDIAKKIHWIPKWGLDRELDWLKNMHDWLISKKRYWGLALPIWECQKCGHFEVIGSRAELKKKAVEGWDKFEGHSPHRPWIDEVKIKCSQCQTVVARIPDVGNPWLDAGIVSFSTMPPDWFPADFITESFPGQFKNWFYSLIAMSTVLKNTNPFKTVLGFATLLDEKGEPMHKSAGNMIEFNEAAEKIGVDVMRWLYARQNPEDNLLFGFNKADEVRRRFYLILWNVYNFFVTYANIDSWKLAKSSQNQVSNHILDRWITSRFEKLVKTVTLSLEKYDAAKASLAIEDFVVANLSTWYVRRSRERVGPTVPKEIKKDYAYQTLHYVLVNLGKILAPFIPFISDEIYRNLTGELSVHLANWPKARETLIDEQIENEMDVVRKLSEAGHAARKQARIKVRQPLGSLTYFAEYKLTKEVEQILADELNVKRVNFKKGQLKVKLVTKLTDDLQEEGQARELVRKIQDERKILGCTLAERVEVILPDWPENFADYIMGETLAEKITKGPNFKIVRKS